MILKLNNGIGDRDLACDCITVIGLSFSPVITIKLHDSNIAHISSLLPSITMISASIWRKKDCRFSSEHRNIVVTYYDTPMYRIAHIAPVFHEKGTMINTLHIIVYLISNTPSNYFNLSRLIWRSNIRAYFNIIVMNIFFKNIYWINI